jgi:hypothetical protein
MKKNEKNILTGIAVAAAGFLAYRFYKIKKEKEAEKKDDVIRIEQGTTTGYPGPNTGPTDYQKKVMELQSWLGVAVDGIPGPQTNGALSKKLSMTYSLVGPISEKNIDQYLALKRGPANLWL